MKRRKNLERAIVLGLLLSTSVYGSAWAEDVGNITGDYNKEFPTSVIVKGDGNSAIEINNKEVNITTTNDQDGTITLESGKYGIRLEGESYVTLTAAKDNEIIVTLDNKEDADGINAVSGATGTINLTANGSNIITTTGVSTDGIYTDKGNDTLISLSAANNDNNNQITAGNNGIDHRGNNTVTLTAKGGNIITAGTAYDEKDPQGDGVRIQGGGTVTLDATYNKIIATDTGLYLDDESTENAGISVIANGVTEEENNLIYGNYIESIYGSAIQSDAEGKNSNWQAGNIEVEASKNIVIGKVNAVYNSGSGIITISAKNPLASEGISTLADYIKYDNILTAGENGVKSDGTGATNVIADNDNIIAGTKNGILSDGAGTITVTAGNNNIIGQYTDKNEKVIISNQGINATDGTVDISSTNNTGIYGQEEAIYNKEANISIEAGKNIVVKAENKKNLSVAISNDNAALTLTGENIDISAEGPIAHAISNNNNGNVTMEADNNININANGSAIAYGLYNEGSAKTNLITDGTTQIVSGISYDEKGEQKLAQNGYGVFSDKGEITIDSTLGNTVIASTNAVKTDETGAIIKITTNGTNALKAINGDALYANGGHITLGADESNFIMSDNGSAVFVQGASSSVGLVGKENYLTGINGIKNTNGNVNLTATGDNNTIFAQTGISLDNNASSANNKASVNLFTYKDNEIYSNDKAIYTQGSISTNDVGTVTLNANNNKLIAGKTGIETNVRTSVKLDADDTNALQVGNIVEFTDETTNVKSYFGDGIAIKANDEGVVTLTAGKVNNVYGAVHAIGTLNRPTLKTPTNVTLDADVNTVYSAAVIENAGDIDTSEGSGNKFAGKKFVSSLYAEDGAHIELNGKNFVGTYADNNKEEFLERTVWAYNEGVINITGATQISTNRYSTSPNSADVAVAAGTATDLSQSKVENFDGTRAEVNIKYNDFNNERNTSSYIEGDILSAYAGLVNIDSDNEKAGINIKGNLLAGNNGILNVDLGKGGTLTGRADDYGDAGNNNGSAAEGDKGHQNSTFYSPAFSSTIYKGGRVDLTMGEGSTWFVTGQSWITNIDTTKANGETPATRATIDLTSKYVDNKEDNTSAHALTVYNFNGDADFKMNLTGDRANSDMLYMKTAKGDYRIILDEAITDEEINYDEKAGSEFSGLRFATVGAGSDVKFSVGSYDTGEAFNVEYTVGQDEYGSVETAHENEAYNGDATSGGKPGNDLVDNFFTSTGTPVENITGGSGTESSSVENSIMLLNDESVTLENTAETKESATAINHKIIARGTETISDTGKTILNMSRANYSNAIYMDRLNKRLGEARYINDDPEEDEGMWVRIRHDRIGKDDAYRSQNTMYELGYDKKQDCDNGERRVGFAVDYMHGDTGYTDIAGKGEIDRYGLWLYDTWMGDKGHYVDYVAKWGHLDNDFEVYTMRDGNKVTGDYSNNVFSVSAEYGRKKDIGSDWYFEPQAQLQLARVTGADYTTNQGTKVSVDGINSLIGRAGFRIGKDFGEEKQSTLYFKADVLHEFLGDQDVYVMDKSSDNKWAGISYDNEGTWYDVGFGFATMMSKNSYAFLDLEKSFGHDNDETYQINAGVQWTF